MSFTRKGGVYMKLNINWTNSFCKKAGLSLAALLLFVLVLSTAVSRSSASEKDDDSSSQADSSSKADELPAYDSMYIKIGNEAMNSSGVIALDNKDHSYTADGSDFASIYQYLFNTKGESIMTTSSTNVCGTKEMMEHLNQMISDFAAQTGLKTIMIRNASYKINDKLYPSQFDVETENKNNQTTTGTDKGRVSSDGCYEHLSGLAVDLQIYEADKGTYPEFTGEGQYSWILENCYKYGFVQRYTAAKESVTGVSEKKNHLRYVGPAYSVVMHDNDLALEELHPFLDKYTYEKPLRVTGGDGANYVVYSVDLEKDKTHTTIPIPAVGSDAEAASTFSGIGNSKVYVCSLLSGSTNSTATPNSTETTTTTQATTAAAEQ